MFVYEVSVNHRTLEALELRKKPIEERLDVPIDKEFERTTTTGTFATDTPDLTELLGLIEKYWLGEGGLKKTDAVIESIKLITYAIYDYKD